MFYSLIINHSYMKKLLIFLFVSLLICLPVLCNGSTLNDNIANESLETIKTSEFISIAFMICILVMKITAFIFGYLVIKMGHDTLVKGITGEFDFGFSGSGFNAKLKSASPGLLFVLLGTAIIIWSMVVAKPLNIDTKPAIKEESTEDTRDTLPDAEKPVSYINYSSIKWAEK